MIIGHVVSDRQGGVPLHIGQLTIVSDIGDSPQTNMTHVVGERKLFPVEMCNTQKK